MSWFRQRGKYWSFVVRREGKERSYYIGNDKAVLRKLLPKKKAKDLRAMAETRSKK